jgi:hypothetical protein
MNGEICDVTMIMITVLKSNDANVCSVRNIFSITRGRDVVLKYANNWLVV